MNLSIEGESLTDIEEKIIAIAADIKERRALLAGGCTCDMTQPKTRTTNFGPDGRGMGTIVPVRCHGGYVVCEARAAKVRGVGSFEIADAASQFVRLGMNNDGTMPGPGSAS